MPHPSIRPALALFALLAAAACARAVAPTAGTGEVEFVTGATLPAVPGFAALANLDSISPRVVLGWQDVEGEDVYLIRWRVGESGSWKTLVTTGRDRTSF